MCTCVVRAHVHLRARWQWVVLIWLYGGSAKVSGSVAAEARCAQDGWEGAAPARWDAAATPSPAESRKRLRSRPVVCMLVGRLLGVCCRHPA